MSANVNEMDMISANLEDFLKDIEISIKLNNFHNFLGLGKSGLGKTQALRGLAEKLGISLKEIRLCAMDEADLVGVPRTVQVDDEHFATEFCANSLLPNAQRDGRRGILVFDEITSARNTLRAACLQLLDVNRKIGNYELPPEWMVVCLGNGPDDGGIFLGLETAFINRCYCYNLETDLKVWKRWATGRVIPEVLAYLDFNPSDFHRIDDPDPRVGRVSPTPRSWTEFSDRVKAARENNIELKESDIRRSAGSSLGNKTAVSFAAFYKFSAKVISVEDIVGGREIVNDKLKTDIGNIEQEARYITIANVITHMHNVYISEKNSGVKVDKSEKLFKALVNATKWALKVSEVQLDLTSAYLQEIVTAPYGELLISEKMDEYVPELLTFLSDNSIIYNV